MKNEEFIKKYKKYLILSTKQFKEHKSKRQVTIDTLFSEIKRKLIDKEINIINIEEKIKNISSSIFFKIILEPFEIVDITGINISFITTSKKESWLISTHQEFHKIYKNEKEISFVNIQLTNINKKEQINYYLVNPHKTKKEIYVIYNLT